MGLRPNYVRRANWNISCIYSSFNHLASTHLKSTVSWEVNLGLLTSKKVALIVSNKSFTGQLGELDSITGLFTQLKQASIIFIHTAKYRLALI